MRGRNSTRETIVWKSLFYPTDTLLQGMRLAPINRRASRLRSWKNSSDPSRGSFTCRVSDTLSQPQLQLTNSRGSDLYYVSGSWNGSVFENIPEVNEKFLFHFKKLDKGFTYSSIYNRTRLVMDINGQLKFFIWHDMDAQWNLVWSVPTNVSGTVIIFVLFIYFIFWSARQDLVSRMFCPGFGGYQDTNSWTEHPFPIFSHFLMPGFLFPCY